MMEQRTDEWFHARCGYISASRVNDLLAKKTTAAYQNYVAQLVAERMTGIPQESFISSAMQWGIDTEPLARDAYQLITGTEVQECGFIKHPDVPMCGASPDGLIGDDGLIEIKCPNTATHIKYKMAGVAPTEYMGQMQMQMACTGRQWCDFFSFDPRLTFPANQFKIRVERDDAKIAEIMNEVEIMNNRVNEIIAAIS